MFSDLAIRMRALFRPNAVEGDLDEELRFHFERHVEKYIQSGLTREKAIRRARLEFGGLVQVKEECRQARGVHFIETLAQDIRYGVGQLHHNVGFTAVAVLSLALGIAVNATFFSAVDALLLRPPADIEAPGRLVSLFQTLATGGTVDHMHVWSYPDYVYYRDHNEVFSGLSAYSPTPFNIGVEGSSEKSLGDLVSGNYFAVLGAKAFRGRMFLPEKDDRPDSPPVAVVSYEFWRSRMGADPAAVGKSITVNHLPFTVIGVAPSGMTDLGIQMAPAVWLPLSVQPALGWPPDESDVLKNRGTGWLTVVGRLKPDITHKQALANLTLISERLKKDYPALEQGRGISIESATSLPPFIRGAAIGFVVLLEALGGLFLLIPCANVGSLLLARGWARQTEMSIRYSLGARRSRIIRQLLSESTLLGLLGGGVGLLLALSGSVGLAHLKPPIGLPIAFDIRPDFRVLGFTLLLALATVLLFGMAPALRLSGAGLAAHLGVRSDSGTSRGLRGKHLLVVAQAAISLLLLLGAGLCIRSLRNAEVIDPGFESRKLLSFSISPTLSGYSTAQTAVYYKQVLGRLRAMAGVRSAALAAVMPLSYGQLQEAVELTGGPGMSPQQLPVGSNLVSSEYFRTIGIPILRGRSFLDGDMDRIIVNESLAKRLFPNQDPIGHRIQIGTAQKYRSMEVIGIAQDSKYRTLGEVAQPFLYEPLSFGSGGPAGTTVLVRTTVAPQYLFSAIRHQVSVLDKNILISPLETMSEHIRSALWLARTAALVLGALGFMGLFLAVIGLYGTVAYSVSRRTHEIGIRIAMGAQRINVLRMVVREGLFLIIKGIGLGLAIAFLLTRFLSSLLYGVSATDPLTFGCVSIVFLMAALAGCCIPAWRAMHLDPVAALRSSL